PGPIRGNAASVNLTGSMRDQIDFRSIPTFQADLAAAITACNADFNKPDTHQGNQHGLRWGAGAMGYSMFNTVINPNGGGKVRWGNCRTDGCCAQAQHAHLQVASSNHPSGVNALMGDGSVKYLKDTVSPTVWWSLGSRAGSETLSADSY